MTETRCLNCGKMEASIACSICKAKKVSLRGDDRKVGPESQEVECAQNGTLESAPLPVSAFPIATPEAYFDLEAEIKKVMQFYKS